MPELNDFFNEGQGWICKPCSKELEPEGHIERPRSRFLQEGEAEVTDLETRALARWSDKTRRFLFCPRCGLVEGVDIF